jgi:hypothetical protein
MRETVPPKRAGAADAVARVFADVLATVSGFDSPLSSLMVAGARPARQDVEQAVAALVEPVLRDPRALLVGAGAVLERGTLADPFRSMFWWLGPRNTFRVSSAERRLRPLEIEEDPEAEDYQDFRRAEWWRIPAQTGQPHLTGPYVDYFCTDEYTVTVTAPLATRSPASGSTVTPPLFAGVIGADLYVADLERVLLPLLAAADEPLSLVSSAGRVLVSTEARRETGSLMTLPPGRGTPLQWGGSGLVLVSPEDEAPGLGGVSP